MTSTACSPNAKTSPLTTGVLSTRIPSMKQPAHDLEEPLDLSAGHPDDGGGELVEAAGRLARHRQADPA
jgi:hypothetical protein